MQIADHSVVLIHYTLRNDAGEVLDSSGGGEPLAYLHGMGNIVRGLEKALAGKTTGDKLQVKVPAEEGYGPRDEKLIQTRVMGDMVTVDGNHLLAGVTLNFEVEVTQVREATGEELAHGHVHGAGGHHH